MTLDVAQQKFVRNTPADAGFEPADTAVRHWAIAVRAARGGAMLVSDAVAFGLAFLLADAAFGDTLAAPDATRPILLAAVLTIALRAMAGLYPGHRLHRHESLRRSLAANGAAGAAACGAVALLAGDATMTIALALWLGSAALLQPILRAQVRRLLHGAGLWAIAADIIADADTLPALTAYFRKRWQYGLSPATGAGPRAPLVLVAGRRFPAPEELRRLLRRYPEVIVLADLPALRLSGLAPRGLGGEIGLRFRRAGHRGAGLKRLCDLAVAIPAAILLAPLVLAAAAAIYAIDPGPVFYVQRREGLGGRPLGVLKLRTMYRDAETLLQDLLAADPEARREWEMHFKLKRDPRILPWVGRFLRASSLDELPQLLNVIRGDMSLVGPRPFPDYHLDAMQPEFRRKRCTVLPGITGLWQISSRGDADLALQQQLDDFYIENRSFWFDLSILIETVPAVILHRGAY